MKEHPKQFATEFGEKGQKVVPPEGEFSLTYVGLNNNIKTSLHLEVSPSLLSASTKSLWSMQWVNGKPSTATITRTLICAHT